MSMSKFNTTKEEIGELEDKPVEINYLKLICNHWGTVKYHTHMIRPERKTEDFSEKVILK